MEQMAQLPTSVGEMARQRLEEINAEKRAEENSYTAFGAEKSASDSK